RVPPGQPGLADPRLPARHGDRDSRDPGRAARGGADRTGQRRGRAGLGGPDGRAGAAAGLVAGLLHRLRDPVARADARQGGPGGAGGDQGGGAGAVPPRGHPVPARDRGLPGHGRLLRGRVHPADQGQPAARGPGGRDPGAARAQRPGRPGAGELRPPARAGGPGGPPGAARGRGPEASAAPLDPRGVGTEEYLAVRTFLTRAPSLAPGPRSALALQLANPLAAKLRPPPPPAIPPEGYRRCLAAAYQQRQRMATGGDQDGGSEGLWTAAGTPPAGELRSPTGGPDAGPPGSSAPAANPVPAADPAGPGGGGPPAWGAL